jgi:hypothetical protein
MNFSSILFICLIRRVFSEFQAKTVTRGKKFIHLMWGAPVAQWLDGWIPITCVVRRSIIPSSLLCGCEYLLSFFRETFPVDTHNPSFQYTQNQTGDPDFFVKAPMQERHTACKDVNCD